MTEQHANNATFYWVFVMAVAMICVLQPITFFVWPSSNYHWLVPWTVSVVLHIAWIITVALAVAVNQPRGRWLWFTFPFGFPVVPVILFYVYLLAACGLWNACI